MTIERRFHIVSAEAYDLGLADRTRTFRTCRSRHEAEVYVETTDRFDLPMLVIVEEEVEMPPDRRITFWQVVRKQHGNAQPKYHVEVRWRGENVSENMRAGRSTGEALRWLRNALRWRVPGYVKDVDGWIGRQLRPTRVGNYFGDEDV